MDRSTVQIPFRIALTTLGTGQKRYPGDYIITFADENISTAKKRISPAPPIGQPWPEIPVNYKVEEISTGISILYNTS